MKIKVCGVNDAGFAVAAARLGVDYLGFIFEPSSPRFVTPGEAAEISAAIAASAGDGRKVRLVGVFVSQSVEEILGVVRETGMDVVQLHRRASAEDVAALKEAGCEVWTLAGGAHGDGVLFDSSHGDGARDFERLGCRTILAGKIGVENVDKAIAMGPDVIDVNSSLETSPGRKSVRLLKELLAKK